MTFYENDNKEAFQATNQISFSVTLYGSVCGFRQSFAVRYRIRIASKIDEVLDLRTALLLLRNCCGSFLMLSWVCIKLAL